MHRTNIGWSVIVLMSALSPASAAQSAGGDGARFAQSPQYPLLPRALEIELALRVPQILAAIFPEILAALS